MLPVIDLDQVSGEEGLLPLVKQVLQRSDTFLLKNYANIESLAQWVETIKDDHQVTPNVPEFGADFTGVLPLDNQLTVEQYVNDENLFSNTPPNVICQHILNHLWQMGQFFTETAIHCYIEDAEDDIELASKLTRYVQTIPQGDEASNHIISIDSSGLLLFFPQAVGIKVKPTTASVDDNVWELINEPDCILVHTGKSIATISNGTHSTTPLQINPMICPTYLTVYPSLEDNTVMKNFIEEQIKEFPMVGKHFYPKEYNHMQLDKEVKQLIKLFNACETVVSLYSIQRPTNGQINPSIQNTILPQISTMLGYKVSPIMFLKMMTLWPRSYELDYNPMDEDDLVIIVPRNNKLISMINDSRKLLYHKYAMNWIDNNPTSFEIPSFQLKKRRIERESIQNNDPNVSTPHRKIATLKRSNYNKTFEEKPFDSQSNLLQRIKMKENTVLMDRERRDEIYDQFLMTKMRQVLTILQSLPRGEPYTITQLTTMIVDSLYDGNNPIDQHEAEMTLNKLTEQHPEINVITTNNGLKVYRWDTQLI
ncbi:cell division cycle protein CDT1 [Monosporozyma unispora]|nr:hypothetical protein C6P44_003908 [Kazachstania unispora]